MGRTLRVQPIIASATLGALVASVAALAIGAALFGLDFNRWAEWEGRVVGAAGTLAGVIGAYAGLRMASRR